MRPPSFKYELRGVWGVCVSNMGVQVNTSQRQKHAVLVTARSDGIGDEEVTHFGSSERGSAFSQFLLSKQ